MSENFLVYDVLVTAVSLLSDWVSPPWGVKWVQQFSLWEFRTSWTSFLWTYATPLSTGSFTIFSFIPSLVASELGKVPYFPQRKTTLIWDDSLRKNTSAKGKCIYSNLRWHPKNKMSAKKKYLTINFIHLIQILSAFTIHCCYLHLHSQCLYLPHTNS